MASFKRTPYEQLALVRLERGEPAEAWEALEAARARVLSDQLLARGNGKGNETGGARMAPFPLSRVQASLEHDQAIVAWLDSELYPGAFRSWACVVRETGPVRWVRIPEATDLKALSAKFVAIRDQMERQAGSLFPITDRSWMSDAHGLWNARVAPLEPYLEGVKELVVVTSWAMGSFPVEMLLDEEGRPLGERFAIVHSPSATVYALLREAPHSDAAEPRTALLVGDPVFHPNRTAATSDVAATITSLRGAMHGDVRVIQSLPRLKHSRDEIEAVAGLLSEPQILLGADANEARLASMAQSGALSRCRVVHIATHALIDLERPQRSGLVLSYPAEAATGDDTGPDGIVTGAEILESWKLDADLVTLSACQTAVGRSIFGEGVVGLSYPLLATGARTLLVSQWKVDDEATALLMKRFYQNWLGSGALASSPRMNKAAALRDARRWLQAYRDPQGNQPFAHPFYWAAFVLVGDPD